jgi:hypothetical protein
MRNLLDRCVESPEMYVKVVSRIGFVTAALTAVMCMFVIAAWIAK